jgi:hypothetical protein
MGIMGREDWRTAAAYEDLRSLDAPGFAWEFLDRNPEFTQERRKLERAARRDTLNPAEADAFTRRWGVRFRGRGELGQRQDGAMGAIRAAHGDCADESSN